MDLTAWNLFFIILGMVLAPRLTISIILFVFGYIFAGALCLAWSIIVGVVQLMED